MSNGRHSYVHFYPSDWISGTARMPPMARLVYFEVCCWIWDKAKPCPDSELAMMLADVPAWPDIVEQLVAIGKLERSGDGLINSRAKAEADRALGAWQAKSGAGQRGAGSKWGNSTLAEHNRKKRSERLAEARRKATHTKEQWAAMLEFHSYRCVTCGSADKVVKDHIIPIYQGGSDGIDNIQPMCRSCNSRKGPESEDLRIDGWQDACVISGTPGRMPGKTSKTPGRTPAEPEPEPEPHKNPPNPPRGGRRFAPPSIEQVREYCNERGNNVDPERWHDHYTANGWKVGKNPMKDWRAAVRTWEKNSNETRKRSAGEPRIGAAERSRRAIAEQRRREAGG